MHRGGLDTMVAALVWRRWPRPVLLHHTVYLADLSGPGSAEWTTAEAAGILLGLAIGLVAVWGLLAGLQSRSPGLALSPVLMLVALACSVTVMLSGYYYGGLLGLPVASALAGAALASRATSTRSLADANLGISLVGIFTVLVIGRFFGSLPTSTAICLGCGPLLAWIVETPPLRRLGPRGSDYPVLHRGCAAVDCDRGSRADEVQRGISASLCAVTGSPAVLVDSAWKCSLSWEEFRSCISFLEPTLQTAQESHPHVYFGRPWNGLPTVGEGFGEDGSGEPSRGDSVRALC